MFKEHILGPVQQLAGPNIWSAGPGQAPPYGMHPADGVHDGVVVVHDGAVVVHDGVVVVHDGVVVVEDAAVVEVVAGV